MNKNEVIKYPILTEKTYSQMDKGIYTFACDFRTNKVEIKKIVEFIFGVKVARVNVANVSKKPTKLGRFAGFTNRYKKAIITLSEGTINLFPEEAKATETKVKKETKVEGPSEAELKAAEKIAAKVKEKEAKEEIKTDVKVSVEKTEEKQETPVKADK